MKEYKIYFPNKITSTVEGYELLLRFHQDLITLINHKIQISFKNVTWVEANLVAVLGAIIEYLEKKNNLVEIIEYNMSNDILIRNGFMYNFGFKQKKQTKTSTPIPYKKFFQNQHKDFNDYIQLELLNKKEFPNHSVLLGEAIKRNIFELFENARTHGKCSYIHTCGQFFPSKHLLNITIVDTGQTIAKNVNNYLNKELYASECIDWAMKTGNTTKTGDISGGLGLGMMFDFIKLNLGKIQIVSSNGFWELREQNTTKLNLNFGFSGTIANLQFNLIENETYRLSSESIDFNNLF